MLNLFCVCSLDLHQEIEELQFHLVRSKNHISQLEHELADSRQLSGYELSKFGEEFARLRERYDRCGVRIIHCTLFCSVVGLFLFLKLVLSGQVRVFNVHIQSKLL